MSSIIEGYNYDIFISYRQNDNKYDGWVTEFVNNLNKELEANIKDKISVYFDINPQDGLLETDSVDKSLEDKLKCLIFVPIISRTYCDSKSFAWQHEFCAFNKVAKEDKFGRDIKLSSGNVASRILPVKINDLDPEDKALLENELGGVLRSIEFIYKSAGVNRPLRANEDHPQDNLNKIYYRDQINKVTNAVKEIITALKKQSQHLEEDPKQNFRVKPAIQKNLVSKIIAGSLILLALIVLGILFIPKLIKPTKKIEKSIAVLPFRNDSPDSTNKFFIDGTMEAILDNLCKIADLVVVSRTSVEQFRNTTKPIREIAKQLDVNYILEGSGQKYGNNIRLTVQLIDAVNDKHIWSSPYEGVADNIFKLQSQISQSIATELRAIIVPEEKQLIEKIPTNNLSAFSTFSQARSEQLKYWLDYTNIGSLNEAMALYRQALQYDSAYAQAYSGLAWGYLDKHSIQADLSKNYPDSILFFANKALGFNNRLDEAFYVKGRYYDITGNYDMALKEYNEAIKLNPNNWMAYASRAYFHFLKDYDIRGGIEDCLKAIQLEYGPFRPGMMRYLGGILKNCGFPETARFYIEEAFKLDNDSIRYLNTLAFLEEYKNDSRSVEISDKVLKKDPSNLDALWENLGCYERLGKYEYAYHTALNILRILEEKGMSPQYGWDYIGFAFWKTGHLKEARFYFDKQIDLCEEILKLDPYDDQGMLALSRVYAVLGEKEKSFKTWNVLTNTPNEYHEHESKIASEVHLNYLKYDPLLENLRSDSLFQNGVTNYENEYNMDHKKLTVWMEEKGMLKE